MPQHSMFPSDRRIVGVRLDLVDRTPDLIDAFDLTVMTRHDRDDWSSLWSGRWSGTMVDLLPSTFQDLAGAFLWDEGARAIAREAQTDHRRARAHHRRYRHS